MQIVAPMIFMFIVGFAFCLLVNPYIRKLFSKKVDWEVEKEEFQKEIKDLRRQIREHEKQARSRERLSGAVD